MKKINEDHSLITNSEAAAGGTWARPEHKLMLRACLLDGDEARQSWEAWVQQTDFDQIDSASFRMVPLLYRNLQELGITHPLMERMKSVYRHTWYRNQLISHRVIKLVTLFQSEDIEVMVFKGIAIQELYYGDKGMRPMNDFDLMVHEQDVDKAHALLSAQGWTPKLEFTPENRKRIHGMSYRETAGIEIDLHWAIRKELGQLNPLLWSGKRELQLNGCTTATMCATDLLFHTLIHGMRWNATVPIRWICDAWFILKKKDDTIDWPRFLQLAMDSRRILDCRETLNYLQLYWGFSFPDQVNQALRDAPVSKVESKAFLRSTQAWKSDTAYTNLWEDFCAEGRQTNSRITTTLKFVFYVKRRWSLPSWFNSPTLWAWASARYAWQQFAKH